MIQRGMLDGVTGTQLSAVEGALDSALQESAFGPLADIFNEFSDVVDAAKLITRGQLKNFLKDALPRFINDTVADPTQLVENLSRMWADCPAGLKCIITRSVAKKATMHILKFLRSLIKEKE